MQAPTPFELDAVVHLIRPWGRAAHDLEQLRAGVAEAPDGVLFRHALQFQLRHPAAESLPPDDFSAWIGAVVQDAETAERMAFAVQGSPNSAAATRAAMLEVLDRLNEKTRIRRDSPEGGEFVFLAADSVRYPTGVVVRSGAELVPALMQLDPSVWFLHLMEEPWERATRAPLLEWLVAAQETRLAQWIEEAALSGLPIDKARSQLSRRWRPSRIAQRLAAATRATEGDRRAAAREAVARLVRRNTEPGESH